MEDNKQERAPEQFPNTAAGTIPFNPVSQTSPPLQEETEWEFSKEIESKLPFGASRNYRHLLGVARATQIGALDRWMKYQEVCQGTAYFNRLLKDIADIPESDMPIRAVEILAKVLPPADAVYAVDFPLPAVFRQYNAVYVDKINVDLSTLPPGDLRLFWWQPVRSPIFMAAVEELIRLVKRWPELAMDFHFCRLPATLPATPDPEHAQTNQSE